jgi:hypothetical protein
MTIILLLAGVGGGIVNYYLPEPATPGNPEPERWMKRSIVLGLGATLMVPLFLLLTDSKLTDDVRIDLKWQAPRDTTAKMQVLKIVQKTDSAGKVVKSDTTKDVTGTDAGKNSSNTATTANPQETGKHYLLWLAYCILAGTAGFRFINLLIEKVVSKDQFTKLNEDKAKAEQQLKTNSKNAQKSQEEEHAKAVAEIAQNISSNSPQTKSLVEQSGKTNAQVIQQFTGAVSALPSVTVTNDPQKGRFGGEANKNDRILSAQVTESGIPDYYTVSLQVSGAEHGEPVLFYLHDSFSPSVRTAYANDKGEAKLDSFLAYGAFTVGAIADYGKTRLELDLSGDKNFPKEFRER